VLWIVGDDPRLSDHAGRLLADPSNDVFLSAAVVWEVAIKRATGKLEAADFTETALAGGVIPLPITIEHAEAAGALPLHHRDPFDRMLIAQAQLEGAAIVSADPALRTYDVRVEW
jgi:PIN domain nuclease of toxin-antitoxin system